MDVSNFSSFPKDWKFFSFGVYMLTKSVQFNLSVPLAGHPVLVLSSWSMLPVFSFYLFDWLVKDLDSAVKKTSEL